MSGGDEEDLMAAWFYSCLGDEIEEMRQSMMKKLPLQEKVLIILRRIEIRYHSFLSVLLILFLIAIAVIMKKKLLEIR